MKAFQKKSFLRDKKKMQDFKVLGKEDFLKLHRWTSEEEYEETKRLYMPPMMLLEWCFIQFFKLMWRMRGVWVIFVLVNL